MSEAAPTTFQYRKAKTSHAVMAMMNSFSRTCIYGMFCYAAYIANVGYGIASAAIGVILMLSRVYDGITDPLAAVMIEKSHFKIGKIRIWSVIGWLIEIIALLLLFHYCSGKGLGTGAFILLYLLLVTGYTVHSCAHSITAPVLTNEPLQRARLGTLSIANETLAYIFCMVVVAVAILPKFGNEYSVEMLSYTAKVVGIASFITLVIAMIGISPYDKAENFQDLTRRKKNANLDDKVKIKEVFTGNKPLRYYIVSAAADGLATQTFNQSVVITLMYGIVTGNYQLGTSISAAAVIPSVIFAFVASKYAAKNGNRKANITWTLQCILIAVISIAFFMLVNTRNIPTNPLLLTVFVLLMFSLNAVRTCVSSCTNAMMADIVDYELYRSGHYIPAIISAMYTFINKIISSIATVIALGTISLVGYKSTLPQPNDPLTTEIKIATMFLFYGVMILGWLVSLWAMKKYELTGPRMKEIQSALSDKQDRNATPEERQEEFQRELREAKKKHK